MNCAETVYALPELDEEAVDPDYCRFIPGLGLTSRMIIPHFQAVQYDVVDGLNAIWDIAFPDRIGKTFIALVAKRRIKSKMEASLRSAQTAHRLSCRSCRI